MAIRLMGKKLGMSSYIDKQGNACSVTLVEAGPCVVIRKKTQEKDGYDAFQMGFCDCPESKITKPKAGQFLKNGVQTKRYIYESRITKKEAESYTQKDEVKVDFFKPGDFVDVSGKTKGRGFAGVVKKYGFKGGSATRGTHEYFRHGGAIGMHSYPGRVLKNKKMPGQYGNKKITIQNLKVVEVNLEKNIIALEGSIPGPRANIVFLQKAVKKS